MARKRRDRDEQPTPVSRKQAHLSRRERERRKLILSITVPLLVLAIGVLVVGAWRELVQIPNTPVAEVEGERIPASDFSERMQYGRRLLLNSISSYLQLLQSNDPSVISSLLGPQREQLPQTTLDTLIDEAIIRQEAKRRGLEATDADVDEEIYGQMATSMAPPPTSMPEVTATPTISGTTGAAEVAPTATPPPTEAVPTIATSEIGRKFDERVQPMLDQIELSRAGYREIVRQTVYRNKLTEVLAEEVPTAEKQVKLEYLLFEDLETANAAAEELTGGATWAEAVAKYGPTPTPEPDDAATEGQGAPGDPGDEGGVVEEDSAAAEDIAAAGDTGASSGQEGDAAATGDDQATEGETTEGDAAAGAAGTPGAEASPTPAVPPTPTPEPNAKEAGEMDWITQGRLVSERSLSEDDAAKVMALEAGQTSTSLQGGSGFYVVHVVEVDEARPLTEDELSQRKESALDDWLKAKRTELTSADLIKRFPLEAFIPPEPLWFSDGWDRLMGQPVPTVPGGGLQISTAPPPVDAGGAAAPGSEGSGESGGSTAP